MRDTKRPIERRIRSAKLWLDKAERSYADDAAMKGDLQLMLAKAELQHLSETKPALYRRVSLRIVIAAICILTIGGAWGLRCYEQVGTAQTKVLDQTENMDVAGTSTRTEEDKVVSKVNKDAADTSARVTNHSDDEVMHYDVASKGVHRTSYEDARPTTVAVEQQKAVSTAQIKQAIREGERSLRGQ